MSEKKNFVDHLGNTIEDLLCVETDSHGLMCPEDKIKLDGIDANANKYTHPTYTAKSSGLYKITVDGTGHVSDATAVAKSDITGLGIPAQDTTYSNMTAATSSAAGKAGLVPAPAAGKQNSFLKGDGTWAVPTDTNTTYTVATGDSNGQIKVTPSSGSAYNVGVKGLADAAYKAVADSTSASAISTGTSLVTERDVYYGLPKINNSNSYTRSTTIYAPTAGGTSKYFLCGAGTTATPTWASPATARTNLELSYGTAAPSGTPSNGAVYFREDIHATLPITEGGTGATSVSAARANLGLNHVGAAATGKGSGTGTISTTGGWDLISISGTLTSNDSNFTITNNGIQCPYSGYVYIEGAIYISSTGNIGCYIFKNGGELHSQYHQASGCVSSGGMLVPVTAGDVITMKARASVSGASVGRDNKGTHLTIIYVS